MKHKPLSQVDVLRSVRKHTVFVAKVQSSPKGERGYNRQKQRKQWRKDVAQE